MPKVASPEFLVGYIRGKMSQVRDIITQLENHNHIYTQEMLDDVADTLDKIHQEIKVQQGMCNAVDIASILVEYVKLSELADSKLNSRYLTAPRQMQVIPVPSQQPGPSRPTASAGAIPKERPSLAQGLLSMDNYRIPKKGKSKTRGELMVGNDPIEDNNDDPLAPYASDSEEPLPLHLHSIVTPGPGYEPIRMQQQDLRHNIRKRQERDQMQVVRQQQGQGNNEGSSVQQNEEILDSVSQQSVPRTTPLNEYRGPPSTTGSLISVSSYASGRMEPQQYKLLDIPYPPFRADLPVSINRNDPELIGSTERYTNNSRSPNCQICRGHHKIRHCKQFLKAGLQERWYLALKHGLCLYCLFIRHSSFSCDNPGACPRCGVRHNSLLCPKSPYNE